MARIVSYRDALRIRAKFIANKHNICVLICFLVVNVNGLHLQPRKAIGKEQVFLSFVSLE